MSSDSFVIDEGIAIAHVNPHSAFLPILHFDEIQIVVTQQVRRSTKEEREVWE